MTTNDPDADSSSREADDCEICALYLLGELSPAASAEFEYRLAQSPQLGTLLQSQAELIDEVSRAELAFQPIPATHTDRRRRLSWLVASAALAACVAWAVFSLRHRFNEAPAALVDAASMVDAATEELLIAKVWAGDTGTLLNEPDDASLADEDPPLELDGEFDVDSALSWMVVAVAAEGSVFVEGDANDG